MIVIVMIVIKDFGTGRDFPAISNINKIFILLMSTFHS